MTTRARLGSMARSASSPSSKSALRSARRRIKREATSVAPRNVTRDVYQEQLEAKVLPAIKCTCYYGQDCVLMVCVCVAGARSRPIYIHQDNPSPYKYAVSAVDAAGRGMHIGVLCQPPRSPDFNVLDLGFFNSIQSVQHRKQAYCVPSLVRAVVEAFEELPVQTLEKCFLTLQAVYVATMLVCGGNNYGMTRVRSVHFPDGEFPVSLPCSDIAYNTAIDALNGNN